MKVFHTGGTGAVGRFVVPALVARGHVVTVMARSAEKAAQVKGQGGIPARVDLFDPGGLAAAVAGHQAVLNLATAIPPMPRMGSADAWAPNSRIRTEGSANLVKAALDAGVERFVQESIAFTYRDRGDAWIAEDAPLETDALTDSSAVAEAKWIGSLHFEDAASAVVAALAAPDGAYNVTDDPVTWGDFAEALGRAVGDAPWLRLPDRLASVFGDRAGTLFRSQRVSNRRLREATGWAPRYPSVREGWPAVVRAMERRGSVT